MYLPPSKIIDCFIGFMTRARNEQVRHRNYHAVFHQTKRGALRMWMHRAV